MDYAWGWWKMTPELTFAGGYNGSLATIGMGIRKVNDYYISRGGTGVDGGDFTQLRVSYASGPVGIAIALEHTDEGDNRLTALGTGLPSVVSNSGSPLGVAGELTYAGDMFNAEIAGFLRDADSNGTVVGGKVTQSQIGLGLGANLSDMFNISVAGSIGNNVWFSDGVSTGAASFGLARDVHIGDGWEVSGAVVATLSDSVSAELGAGFSSYDHDHSSLETDTMAIAGGVYWSPVSQLKMGVQASLVDIDNSAAVAGYKDEEQFNAAFVTWWNF
jgi:hypothetical protein